MVQDAKVLTAPSKDNTHFFKGLSTAYGQQTGNSTYNVARQFLSKLPRSDLTSARIVHDNACGIGTATFALLAATADHVPQRVEATDNSPAMISQLENQVTKDKLDFIHPAVQDSHALPFADDTFDLSMTNIGVTNFSQPPKALSEIRRTLKRNGLAVVSIWKRFSVADTIHRAQRSIKGSEAKSMPIPQKEYFQDGYLRDRMVDAGFTDVQQSLETTRIEGEALQGLRGFMIGPLTQIARAGWTEEEEAMWEGAIDESIKQEIEANSGFVMEAWFVTGRK